MTTVNLFASGETSIEQTPSRPRWSLLQRVSVWIERSRQRRALAELDDYLLRDIGLTRYEAAQEWSKPFWL